VRVAPYVESLLRAAGITVKEGIAHIPEALARRLLDLVPRGFCLYDRLGKPAVQLRRELRQHLGDPAPGAPDRPTWPGAAAGFPDREY
jgi:trimethylamine:corrinoid methyltransferase-like protein